MLRFVVVTLACLCLAAADTQVKECKGKPFPLSVQVAGCETPPCEVIKGKSITMDVQFVGNRNNLQQITTKVTAKVLGMNLPYELDDSVSNVCRNLLFDAMCPIDKGEDVTYRFDFFVEPVFPEITADVTVTLHDDQDETITCFICSCKIRKGPTQREATILDYMGTEV